jgi:cell division transport system permease protein
MSVLALRLALSHLRRHALARIGVVLSIACILMLNGMIYMLFQSFSRSLAEVRSSRYATAYLAAEVPPAQEAEVLSAVKKVPGVASAQLVSRDAFLANFSRFFPRLSSELATIDADTIPRYLKIKVAEQDEAALQANLSSVKGIEQVEINRSRYAGLIGALSTLRRLALALMAGMSIALLCILLNHFKLSSSFQAQVKSTLTLLGARPRHVLLPFALEGLIEGLAGGALAAGLLLAYGGLFVSQVNSMFSAIGYHPYRFEISGLALVLAGIGTLSGMIGSLWAAARAAAR